MIDDDFMEFMKELPVGFMQYLYEVYQLNQFAEQQGVSSDSVGMSIQGDNFRMIFTTQPPKHTPIVKPITDQEIRKLNKALLYNGLSGLDKDK